MLLPPVEPNQYTSISFAETRVLEGIAASIGSVGDAYDTALAESTIGLFKMEAVSKSSPFLQGPIKTIDDIEFLGDGMGGLVKYPPSATAPWTTSLRTSSRPSITLNYRFSNRRCRQHRSGKKPGTVHTAVRKLTNPNLTWETIDLELKPPVAVSTARRRYEKFDITAREVGFTSPPLPDLRSAESPADHELTTV